MRRHHMSKSPINKEGLLHIHLIVSLCHETVALGWKHIASTLGRANNNNAWPRGNVSKIER